MRRSARLKAAPPKSPRLARVAKVRFEPDGSPRAKTKRADVIAMLPPDERKQAILDRIQELKDLRTACHKKYRELKKKKPLTAKQEAMYKKEITYYNEKVRDEDLLLHPEKGDARRKMQRESSAKSRARPYSPAPFL